MQQHRGEILEKAIRESGFSITKLANRINKSRQYIYNLFDNPNVNPDILVEISKIIGHNFIEEIDFYNYVEEPRVGYEKLNQEVNQWKNKYMKLLEKYNKLLEENKGKN